MRFVHRGLARIMPSLARVPQQRVGAFASYSAGGSIALTSRPLTCTMMVSGNEGAPQALPPGVSYGCADALVADPIH